MEWNRSFYAEEKRRANTAFRFYPDQIYIVRHHMHLHEVIAGLSECPAETMIFAERIGGAFRPESTAVLLELSESELSRPVREVAAERAPGMEYFLEVFIALEMLEGLRSKGTEPDAIVERIIYYAEHDA